MKKKLRALTLLVLFSLPSLIAQAAPLTLTLRMQSWIEPSYSLAAPEGSLTPGDMGYDYGYLMPDGSEYRIRPIFYANSTDLIVDKFDGSHLDATALQLSADFVPAWTEVKEGGPAVSASNVSYFNSLPEGFAFNASAGIILSFFDSSMTEVLKPVWWDYHLATTPYLDSETSMRHTASGTFAGLDPIFFDYDGLPYRLDFSHTGVTYWKDGVYSGLMPSVLVSLTVLDPHVVPEPGGVILFALGAAGLALFARGRERT